MSAIIGQEWRPKTFKELFIQYQSYILEQWMHTASLRASFSMSKKTKIADFHPLLDKRGGSKEGFVLRPRKIFSDN